MSEPAVQIAILMENDFYEPEIFYYQRRFAEEGWVVQLLTRLWGQESLTFLGHEFRAPIVVHRSFERMSDEELRGYAAIIVPAGYVADRLRYTEAIRQLPPAAEFLKRAFAEKRIIKGIICHGLWLAASIAEVVRGRRGVVHHNLLGDAENMGLRYIDEDVVVDDDLVTARSGSHCHLFARKIIELIARRRAADS